MNGNTSRNDLIEILKNMRLNTKKINIDWSKTFQSEFDGGQILNLGDQTKDEFGTHWVCTFRNKNSKNQMLRDGVYFDSFGLYIPENIEKSGFDYTPLQFQNRLEEFCGQWCCYFLHFCFNDNIEGFYSSKEFKILNTK